MNKTFDAVVAGHICLDISPAIKQKTPCRIEDIFYPGKLTNVGKAEISAGGAVANTGAAMALMGFKVELMARTGRDFFGRAVLDIMNSHGANHKISASAAEETSYSIVLSPPGIDRMFLHNPGANDNFGFEDIDFDAVRKARLFHMGYPPLLKKMYINKGRELKKIFKQAKSCRAATSLDMSLPDPESYSGRVDWAAILRSALPFVDIFLPSAEELFFMLRKEEFLKRKSRLRSKAILDTLSSSEIAAMGEESIAMGAGVCVIKCGSSGLYLRSSGAVRTGGFPGAEAEGGWADREMWAPPYRARKFVSAIGAGDNAAAGFLGAVLKGCPPEFALSAAAACGAINVEFPDALSGVRPWDEICGIIKSGRQRHKINPGKGWRLKEDKSLWLGGRDKKPNV